MPKSLQHDRGSGRTAIRKGRPVTILDVAQAANVSPSTVSLVTNGTGYVSDDKRKVIEEIVRKSGYKPRGRRKSVEPAMQAPSPQQMLDVVVIYVPVEGRPGSMTPSALSAIEGINVAFGERQIRPSLIAAAGHVDHDMILLSHLKSRAVDGAILMGLGGAEARGYPQHLCDAGVPVVLVGHRAPHQKASSVNADFFQGSVEATVHLIGLGHRYIGFAGWDPGCWPTAERCRGYEYAMQSRGLTVSRPFYTHHVDADQRRSAMAAYLREAIGQGHTAFVMGDFQAQLAVPLLEEMGKCVPRDISVVGFDHLGLKLGRQSLSLASIDFDKHFLGATAVQTLLEVVESRGRYAAIDKTICVELYPGQTTASVQN